MMQKIAVIGLGTMGSGIAQVFAAAGCRVACFDQAPPACASLHDRIGHNLKRMSDMGLLNANDSPTILGRINVASSEESAAAGAEFMIEAVAEILEIKRQLWERLERVVSADTILASNTSSLKLADITSHLRNQDRVVVAHWFNPAHIVPVVEVVPGPHTSAGTMNATIDLLRRAGKLPVRLNREVPGFIVNRVQVAMLREVFDLLEQGVASAEDIDAAIRGSMGFRLAMSGPLEVCDFGGLDIWRKVFENLAPQIRSNAKLPTVIHDAVDTGHFGAKTGQGIYNYRGQDLQAKQADRESRLLQLLKLISRDGK